MQNGSAQKFGEVVEASIDQLIGQCHRLYEAPPLGTLVRAGDSVYGVVSGITTTALDPTRRVIARGGDAPSEAHVYAEHPQLERLLRTDVTVSVVGHRDSGLGGSGELRQYLPSLPPHIHTFLHRCPPNEVREFFAGESGARLDFVTTLAGGGPMADDVLAAALREAAGCFEAPRTFLVQASRAVASLLAGDTGRVNAILRRLPLGDGA